MERITWPETSHVDHSDLRIVQSTLAPGTASLSESEARLCQTESTPSTRISCNLHGACICRPQSATRFAAVRTHLQERAGALHETGVSEEQAERQAVQAFGPVRRISQELRAAHPSAWGMRRWLIGMLTGAVVIYALYVVESVPVLISYYYQPNLNMPPLTPRAIWDLSTGSMVSYFWSTGGFPHPVGQLWVLLSFLVLYPVLPFLWGRRAQHWWVPGLAYGLGTGLLVIVELFNGMVYNWWTVRFPDPYTYSPDQYVTNIPFAWISAASLTLALAASFVGWWWRERSASALARAQAA
jgi:hypothetical protein